MIVECGACHARFRLDESRIKGKGARVRCRKCGDAIIVMKPDSAPEPPAPPAPPASRADQDLLDLSSIVRESLSAPPSPATPPPKDDVDVTFDRFLSALQEDPTAASLEPTSLPHSVEFAPEEKLDLPRPTEGEGDAEPRPESLTGGFLRQVSPPAASAAKTANQDSFLLSDSDSLDFLKDEYRKASDDKGETFDISGNLFLAPPPGLAEDAPPAQATPADQAMETETFRIETIPPPAEGASAAVPETAGVPPSPRMDESVRTPRLTPERPEPMDGRARRSVLARPPIVALVLLFVLLAGAGAWLGFTRGGQEVLRRLIPGMEAYWLGSAGSQGPHFDVRNVIGYYEPGAKAGRLFVIKGQVANQGRSRKSGVRIRAALLGEKDQIMVQKTIFAGNALTGDALRQADHAKIEEAMNNRFGDKLTNMDIPPGKTLPFMVVFFDAPEGIGSYRLEALDGE